jgi:NhaP-type Na+/H+ and K+/H+ antiporter
METKMDSITKPVIFMMAGPLVGWSDILEYLPLGMGCLCLFLISRAIAVHLSLIPASMTISQKKFMMIIRETGVLHIVLTVLTIAALPNIQEIKPLMPLVAIVVLFTLVILPMLTPSWARTLKLVKV